VGCIPEVFLPNEYCMKELEIAKTKLAALEAMSAADLDRAAYLAWDNEGKRQLMQIEGKYQLLRAYNAMLRKVKACPPPTPSHELIRAWKANKNRIAQAGLVERFVIRDANEQIFDLERRKQL
jgi:hypothetical protein